MSNSSFSKSLAKNRDLKNLSSINELLTSPTQGLWLSKQKYKGKLPQNKDLENALKTAEFAQIHKYQQPRIQKIPITGKAGTYQADLMFLDLYKKYNSGYSILLNVIEITSKYLFSFPLKSKSDAADELINLMNSLGDNTGPVTPPFISLTTDKGNEFVNNKLKSYCKSNNITLRDTLVKTQTAIVERVNGTIRSLIERYLTINNTYKWISALPDIIANYNSTISDSTGVAPNDVTWKVRADVRINLVNKTRDIMQTIQDKFPPGSKVRIKKAKTTIWEKGAVPKWSSEVYTVKSFEPLTSIIVTDENDKETKVAYYNLLPVSVSPYKLKKAEELPSKPLVPRYVLRREKKIQQQEKSEDIKKENILPYGIKRERKPNIRLKDL
jgi:hypothetical protein